MMTMVDQLIPAVVVVIVVVVGIVQLLFSIACVLKLLLDLLAERM